MRAAAAACAVLLVVVAAVAACVTAEGAFRDKGLAAAAFDLQCPADQVEVTVLNRNDGLGCAGSKVGVRGCGKQTTYVCDQTQKWLRESEVQAADAAAPAPAPAAPAPAAPAPASGW